MLVQQHPTEQWQPTKKKIALTLINAIVCISTNVIYVSSNDFDIKPNERVNQASILNEALVPVFALKESLPLSHKIVHIYIFGLGRCRSLLSCEVHACFCSRTRTMGGVVRCKKHEMKREYDHMLILTHSNSRVFVYFHGACSFNELQLRNVCLFFSVYTVLCCLLCSNFPSLVALATDFCSRTDQFEFHIKGELNTEQIISYLHILKCSI